MLVVRGEKKRVTPSLRSAGCYDLLLSRRRTRPMKRRNGLTLAAVVLLFSACSMASTIDPGGIIRRGSDYPHYAIIEPGLVLTFNGDPVTSFDPFHVLFCSPVEGGQQCNFENQSGE